MNAEDSGGSGIETGIRPASNLRILFVFLVCMLLGIFLYFEKNEKILVVAMGLITILELVNLLRMYSASKKFQAISEGAWFIIMLSIFVGPYRLSLMDHQVFTLATILYRPYYTNYCNLRLALIVGLSNMALVLPVTCGLVTDPGLSELLAVPYVLLVASLWVFCSELGADILGFERAG
jgi:hypothetical protein